MFNNEFSDNLSKYANPGEYDKTYKGYTADLAFIEAHLAGNPQAIIELACGTGRLAIPLAKQGHTVYGVDIDAGMLKFAQEKATAENLNIHLSLQDCTQLNLPIQSNFIYMTGNSFQHFLTNESQDALFDAVKKHLNPNGEFIFDTRNPILHELVEGDCSEEAIVQQGELTKVISREIYNPLTQILECTSTYITSKNEYQDHINLRYTYPLELKRLLHQHGFELIALYGSWKKEVFDEKSVSMVVHAQLKS
ncbi:class I SAM-dependent methyltransferase [Solibacillus sp. FSL R7-0668]|uniref:class I SAM-dependent methyltransferase n=1 Tax=Solibacillus sp. FSL R7-0668 TaxID=2921688 RepID=UPI0030F95E52